MVDHKVIVNSDGANFEIYDSKPEFSVTAIAKKGGNSATAHEGVCVTGGWDDLFKKKSHLECATTASEKSSEATRCQTCERKKGYSDFGSCDGWAPVT